MAHNKRAVISTDLSIDLMAQQHFLNYYPYLRLSLLFDEIWADRTLMTKKALLMMPEKFKEYDRYRVFYELADFTHASPLSVLQCASSYDLDCVESENMRTAIIMLAHIRYAKDKRRILLVGKDMFDEYSGLCNQFEPDYLATLKRGRLLVEILNYVIDFYIPSFCPPSRKTLGSIRKFKAEFSDGIFSLSEELGGYSLNEANKEFIRSSITRMQKDLNQILRPDRIRSLLPSLTEGIGMGAEIVEELAKISIPFIDVPIKAIEKIRNLRIVKRKNLGFAISLETYRMIFEGARKDAERCTICEMTENEIEQISDDAALIEALSMTLPSCERHMVAYLNLRKQHQLVGKALLLAMKKYG